MWYSSDRKGNGEGAGEITEERVFRLDMIDLCGRENKTFNVSQVTKLFLTTALLCTVNTHSSMQAHRLKSIKMQV